MFVIIDNWLFGVGIGDYSAEYKSIFLQNEHFWTPTNNAHNEFLMISAQTGIIGLVLFGGFLVSLFKSVAEFSCEQSKLAVAVIITILIACLFNSSFLDHSDGTLLMLLIALFFSRTKVGS